MANQKITDYAALLGAGVDAAADLLEIVDADAGVAGSKKITVAQLFATPGLTLVTPALGTPASGTLTNCDGTASSLTSGITAALKSATTTVDVSAATAPSSGQVLTATAGTTATWQTPAAAGATLGANTFTALQTITQASADAGILASTGYSLTGSDATSMVDLAGTWNTTGTPTALKLNVTDTASNASSLLMVL